MVEVRKEPKNSTPPDISRRNFLKVMMALGVGAVTIGAARGAIQNLIPGSVGISTYPTLTLVNASTGKPIKTSDLTVNNPAAVVFDYPLQNEPNFLLRLGDSSGNDVSISPYNVQIPATGGSFRSPGGAGPYKSVVSSSAICQHLGCTPPSIHFYKPGTAIPNHPGHSGASNTGFINCNCHGSTYDPYKGFSVVTGPTKSPLPNVILSWESSSDTYTVKSLAGPTIFGHTSDLSGGNPVSSSSQTDVTTIND
ncbi:MAG: (2Fe-2S)-binding protein [Thermoplasmatales archaeon B_DKE]|nr:MAG: (2Fe-2S)-binding protein [Thermoplasmatales archaeon B_DKE]QRF75493.1 cytochrome b6-f complex iron-sulfur subunit [Thermoplasmatales archaeon]